jgi:hypothetical protein
MVVALEHRGNDLFVAAERAPEGKDEERETEAAEEERSDGEGDSGVRLGHAVSSSGGIGRRRIEARTGTT